ncbi:putative transketolase N-terminal section [Candidatus Desulfarcum epimagneticum]|uniref:Putative transketolase N-terminal section n=1 Tax=uncultured Desulfobacteraceae bacterium TaxID=218296 RepID=A0A484HMJ7_9BACT|nr:putative transketolase N-terminal section [uncultured Desulfobacteraceae bacterium]
MESFLIADNESKNMVKLDSRSLELRKTIIKIMEVAGRGHPGAAMSLVEILRTLYDDILRYDPKNPYWKNRDRCILSKGHGCLALYPILAEKGFFPVEELWKFCKSDGILGGHPEYGKIPGVEASTGSLGHGLSIGLGFALNARIDKESHKIFVILGDGESNEGSIWEAALCAGKHGLSNLAVIVDYNKRQSYGETAEVQPLEPLTEKWKAFGFGVSEVDGHDVDALRNVFSGLPIQSNKPSVVICHTVKGKGFDFMENNCQWHHKSKLTKNELANLYKQLEEIHNA